MKILEAFLTAGIFGLKVTTTLLFSNESGRG